MTGKISDAEFMELWKRHGGASGVAKAAKINVRSCFERRKFIEQKYGIVLESTHILARQRPKMPIPKNGFRAMLDVVGHVMVGSDGHFWPGERSVAFDAFIKLIPVLKPAIIVMNGDSFDGARISRHPPGGWAKLPDVADELAAVKERHCEIEALAPENTPLVWCAGNHDSRFTARLAQVAPDYIRVHGTDIADHFPSWQFCWSLWVNTHTVIKHKFHQGIHAAYNNVLRSGKNIISGHTHRLHATQFADYNGIRWGVEAGTLSEIGPSTDKFAYAEDNPSIASKGFVVLSFTESGMLLEPEFCRALNGVAYFRGVAIT